MFPLLRKPVRKSARKAAHRNQTRSTPLSVERLEARRVLDAGDLDLTWGGDGLVETNVSQGDGANALAIQADGKVVAAGWYSPKSSNQDFAVVRYNTDGSLDASFGAGGVVKTSFSNKSDVIAAAAIQADGKIVVGGWSTSGNDRTFALARYNANGTLDSSFGSGGKVTTNIGSGSEWIADLAIQADGKIVVAGRASIGGGTAVARYNVNGTLDASFGSGGKVTAPWLIGGGSGTEKNKVVIQPDGRILVSSMYSNGGVVRLNANGSLDTTFATGGRYTGLPLVWAIALQGDQIIVSGESADTSVDDAMVRLNADGSVDTSFGVGGMVQVQVDLGRDVAVQPDGKILIAGQQFNTNSLFGLAAVRYNADGSLDSEFGTDGIAIAPQPNVVVTRVRLAPDGKIVVTAYGNDFFTARFESDPPALAAGGGASDGDIALMLYLAGEEAARRRGG
jgi:uncharacterized delta-60 repeat protein